MMAKTQKEKPTLTMDDKEYIIEELTDEQRMLCQHKQDLDNKLATNRFIGDQLVMGIEGVETRLRASLEAEEVEEKVEA
tara:strand:- start:286 stop:522 length:237 start_codon:yes stop_codon:yes gene_type:complete